MPFDKSFHVRLCTLSVVGCVFFACASSLHIEVNFDCMDLCRMFTCVCTVHFFPIHSFVPSHRLIGQASIWMKRFEPFMSIGVNQTDRNQIKLNMYCTVHVDTNTAIGYFFCFDTVSSCAVWRVDLFWMAIIALFFSLLFSKSVISRCIQPSLHL